MPCFGDLTCLENEFQRDGDREKQRGDRDLF